MVYWSIYEKYFRQINFLKTFTLENLKKKGSNILPRSGLRSPCLLFRSAHIYPRQPFQSGTNCLLHRKQLTAKKTKRFHLIQKFSPFENRIVVTLRLSLNYSLLFLRSSKCKFRHTSIQIQTNIQENWSN
jgi:hypothetical protein